MNALAPSSAFQGLIYNVFQQPRGGDGGGLIVCFTSATRGEGVTHVVRALSEELGGHSIHRVARVDLAYLQSHALPGRSLTALPAPAGEMTTAVEPAAVSDLVAGTTPAGENGVWSRWHGSWQYRMDCIHELRSQFDYVLIDCPAMRASSDVLSLASLVDGVILVVEADKTTKDEVAQAERQIEMSGGKCFGHILNKRKYLIPEWIYKHL